MKQKLNCVLLIDDDEATNFINEMLIEEKNCAEKVVSVTSAKEALAYLCSPTEGEYPQPDLIFLDINMPAMNGWEFMDAYRDLPQEQRGKMVVVMLTTSVNPEDIKKAKTIPDLAGFEHKPLSMEILDKILQTHFGGYLLAEQE